VGLDFVELTIEVKTAFGITIRAYQGPWSGIFVCRADGEYDGFPRGFRGLERSRR
jgi:hypothetical protein